jgi:predicted RNA-binding protein with PUA-like domain
MSKRFWLMKSEPEVYSIHDLERDGTTGWEGVRNYQARNFMRDDMKDGDGVLFYHSNASPPGIAGLARMQGTATADPTQFEKNSDYFDPGSTQAAPRWLMVQLAFVERFPEVLSLEKLKADSQLAGLALLAKGQRLSVQPVSSVHFARILKMAKASSKP